MAQEQAQWVLSENQIQTGIIKNCHNGVYVILHSSGMVQARKAISCLLVPEIGDRVAFLEVAEKEFLKENGEEYFILHILQRDESKGQLILPNHTIISQERQRECVHTSGLTLASKKEPSHLEIQSDTCSIKAEESILLQSEDFKGVAKNINLTATHTVLTGNTLTTRFKSIREICEHALYKVKNCMGFFDKKVEKIETLMDIEAQQANIKVDESLRIRSERASIKAKETMTIDGKHINVG